jgi:ubiquitin C-terminal hydrolase
LIENWESEKYKNRVVAKKFNIIFKWPKYLFIMFKIYDNSSRKINNGINIPFTWTIKNNYQDYSITEIYEFSGGVIHFGSLSGGHYIAIIRKNNKYYLCNDSHINEIEESKAHEMIRKAYLILFIKK